MAEQIDLFEFSGTETLSPAPKEFDPAQIPTHAGVQIPPGTYSAMGDLVEPCNRCHRCGLGATRTHAVIGRGNPNADVLIIGEGPGQTEDETGQPFVGRAGQLLDKILAAVQFDASHVYIANIVKCRPPDNRKPTDKEMQACMPYLREQIRLQAPKIILLMGATSVQGLIGDKRGITKIRGEWIEWEGKLCMPMLHPAYLLRNPSREPGKPKWQTWQDIQAVRLKYDAIQHAA
ncbi:MAG: uracil-DNA glycosylase [Synechococcales cyanobacterium RU_4_20]|nr:uracil-DNA glycosylase [Synechococcales cyanobacterium RU_4_20]NJR67924.1 uracil-DNA glycosylase [Synechococcales cyanobacterium CRU_2_2]